MALMITCKKCSKLARQNGIAPRQFSRDELWKMPNDKEDSCRCPDCGHTNQADVPAYMRTTFDEVETK